MSSSFFLQKSPNTLQRLFFYYQNNSHNLLLKPILMNIRRTQQLRYNSSLKLESLSHELILEKRKNPEPKVSLPSISQLIESDASFQSPDYFQVHNLFTVKDLFEAKVHLGHKVGSFNPSMRPFVFGSRFETIIFDLDLTAFYLRQALNFIAHIAYRDGIILFVTRSPATLHLVEKTAFECGEYAHTREWDTKVFTDSINKFGGITRLPDVVIFLNTLTSVLSMNKAVNDSARMLIPTVGVVDSNCSPNLITYPIPGNDDSLSAIKLYCSLFKEAILRGKSKRKLQKQIKE